MQLGDQVKVTSGKNAGLVGVVAWFGITRRQEFKVAVKHAALGKVWVDPSEIVNADGSPVQVDLTTAPLSAVAWAQQQRQAPHTRKRSVPEVRDLEQRVAALETLVASLVGRSAAA